MKRLKHAMLLLLPLVAALEGCEDFGSPPGLGELRWTLDRENDVFTKATSEIPDTNDFLLTISNSEGKILYDGAYGDSPEALEVEAGSYTVSVSSIAFTAPGFAKPQYGDEQVVCVKAGSSVTAKLTCTLRNAGIRLRTASDFLTAYPGGVLYVKSADGRLMYSYSEKRIAYFKPGSVSVTLYNEGKEETLLTRTLEAREILTVNISAPGGAAGTSSLSVSIDTTKTWNSENYIIGGGSGSSGNQGDGTDSAISAADAAAHAGEEDVWVFGYIVGGDLTSAGSTVKTSGITKNTHLAIAARSTVTAKASCVAVELPKGEIRDALNLVDHPDLIGSRLYVRGNLVEAYFGTTGLKKTDDYILK